MQVLLQYEETPQRKDRSVGAHTLTDVYKRQPYDCVFNDYGNIDMMNGFDENEHRRLAADFRNLS